MSLRTCVIDLQGACQNDPVAIHKDSRLCRNFGRWIFHPVSWASRWTLIQGGKSDPKMAGFPRLLRSRHKHSCLGDVGEGFVVCVLAHMLRISFCGAVWTLCNRRGPRVGILVHPTLFDNSKMEGGRGRIIHTSTEVFVDENRHFH